MLEVPGKDFKAAMIKCFKKVTTNTFESNRKFSARREKI